MNGQMDHLIRQAEQEVADNGLGASDKAVMLSGLAWLAKRMCPEEQRRSPRQVVLHFAERAGPWSVVSAVLIYVLSQG